MLILKGLVFNLFNFGKVLWSVFRTIFSLVRCDGFEITNLQTSVTLRGFCGLERTGLEHFVIGRDGLERTNFSGGQS